MLLYLKRSARKSTYTIGHLYIDGEYFCDTIEDKDRGLSAIFPLEENLAKKKINVTAIPTGTYKITMDTISPKFKDKEWAKPYGGKIPRFLNVPAFDGILIHPGTDETSTSGCIIVGQNKVVGKVINSQQTFHKLMREFLLPARNKDESIYIQIQ